MKTIIINVSEPVQGDGGSLRGLHRQDALEKLLAGYTQDMLREEVLSKKKNAGPEDPAEALKKEKQRILI